MFFILTFVDDSPLRPVLDDHGKGPYSVVEFDIGTDQVGVLQGYMIVEVQIAVEVQFWIPYLHYGNGLCVDAFHILHAV